jgi:hypothetical protein
MPIAKGSNTCVRPQAIGALGLNLEVSAFRVGERTCWPSLLYRTNKPKNDLAYSQNATIGTLNETAFSPSLRSGLPPALAYNEGTITDFPRPINE